MKDQTPFHYDVDSFIAAGSFGKVYSAVVRSPDVQSTFSPRARALVIDDHVVLKSALLSRIHRVKDLRGGNHGVSLDQKFSGNISGDAFEPRELQMSSLLGQRLNVKALLAQESHRLRKRSRGSNVDETSIDESTNDETSNQSLVHDETMIEKVEIPLFPTLFDAFFVFDPSLGERPKDGGSINLVLVNELKGADLWALINLEPERFAQDSYRREILRQAFELLSRLHKKRLIHRDIKLPNLLLDVSPAGFPLLRLGDCGSTREIPEEEVSEGTPYVCSRFYRAPELLCGSSVYGFGVDVWSIGCTLVELYTQLASNTDARAYSALSLLRGDGSSNPHHKQSASRRRCALFHGAKNDGAQICQILNLLGPPTDADLTAMKIPSWAEDWLRAQRWFIETSAAIEASGSMSLMQQFLQEVSDLEALIDPEADLSGSRVGETTKIPEIPPQLSTSLINSLANLKRVTVGSLDMKSILHDNCFMPKDVADLLARCFVWNPEKRITCEEALLHPALLYAQPFMPPQAEPSRLERKQMCNDALEELTTYIRDKSTGKESSREVALVNSSSAFAMDTSSSSQGTRLSSISLISSAASSSHFEPREKGHSTVI